MPVIYAVITLGMITLAGYLLGIRPQVSRKTGALGLTRKKKG